MRRFLIVMAACAVAAPGQAVIWGFAAPLIDGSQEVPPTGSTAFGTASFNVDDTTFAIVGSVTVTGIASTAVTGMHIHRGAVGVNGPVIYDILATVVNTFTSGPSTNYFFLGTIVSDGAGTQAQKFADLVAENAYVNVHTPTFPGGEIRGQIHCVTVPEPSTFAALALGIAPFLIRRKKK